MIDFLNEKNIQDDSSLIINIPTSYLPDLIQRINDSLVEHLNTTYIEPSTNEIQKHPTRYERIELQHNVYKVNYRMSVGGRTAFAVYQVIKFLEKAIIGKSDVILFCE
jgi:hypothetical protein